MILRRLLLVVLLPVLLLAMIAWAAAGEDPAAAAKRTLAELDEKRAAPALSGAAPSDHASSALEEARHPIEEARRMLARAAELRALGDARRAENAEDAALEWALAARELVRAVELERDGREQALAAADAGQHASRARALLEEAIARRARLQKDFDAIESDAQPHAVDAGPKPKSGAP